MATTLPVVSPWFAINEVDHGVICITEPHCHRLIRANCFLIEGGDFDILFDSGMGVVKLRPVIEALSAKPLIVFTSHTHIDHVGSHPEFGEAEILVHPLEADVLRRPGAKGLAFAPRLPAQMDALRKAGIELTEFMTDAVPWAGYDTDAYGRTAVEPTRLVEEGAVIETGRLHFEVLHLPGHSPGSIALWEPDAGLFFAGDVIYDGVIVDTAPGSDVAAYRKTMTRLRLLPVRKVFGGHKEPMDRDRMVAIANQYLASSLVGTQA
jgi:glyoxylase-like metal-dependent hydrolase (beta-lactamase superfamily II)